MPVTSDKSFKMKNRVCLYYKNHNTVYVDVNGPEGPNSAMDQFKIQIDPNRGVASDMPRNIVTKGFHCSKYICSACTKCYCGYALNAGNCKDVYADSFLPGCFAIDFLGFEIYSNSTCTSKIQNNSNGYFCTDCTTEQLSKTTIYKKSGNNCEQYNVVTCASATDCTPL